MERFWLTRDKSGDTKLWDTHRLKRDLKQNIWYAPYGNISKNNYAVDYHLFSEDAITWEDEPKEVIIALADPWHSNKETPENGHDILTYKWWDGPHYSSAYYDSKNECLVFDDINEKTGEPTTAKLEDIEKWMYIPEPKNALTGEFSNPEKIY